jgi:hypothetical protein
MKAEGCILSLVCMVLVKNDDESLSHIDTHKFERSKQWLKAVECLFAETMRALS